MNRPTELLFEKTNTIIIPQGGKSRVPQAHLVMSLVAEFMKLGFYINKEGVEKLSLLSENSIVNIHQQYLPFIAKKIGADRDYYPIYEGFPQEVIESSEFKLFYNAWFHYASYGEWTPPTVNNKDIAFEGVKNFKLIKVITTAESKEAFDNLFENMIMSNSALTTSDFEDLQELSSFISLSVIQKCVDLEPKFKENKIALCSIAKRKGVHFTFNDLTDILRLVVYESTCSGNLNTKENFKKIGRPERKYLLRLMENIFENKGKKVYPDLLQNKQKWLRLGERIHPREYQSRFPLAAEAFSALRSGNIYSDESLIDRYISENDYEELFSFLQQKPGVFARKLFRVLCLHNNLYLQNVVLERFEEVAHKVSSNVLCQMYAVFVKRNLNVSPEIKIHERNVIYVPKNGSYAEYLLERDIKKVNSYTLIKALVIIRKALLKRFSGLPPFSKETKIDNSLKNVPVPYGMRTSQKGLETLIRGTRLPMNTEAKVLRAYVHWYDKRGEVDLDLSASFLDEDFIVKDTLSWQGYKPFGEDSAAAVHSGDVRHRRGPCAEYVDLDMGMLLKHGIRYVVIDVRNFDNDFLSDVPDAVFGWMGRSAPESNHTFVPDTIEHAIPITSDNIGSLVCVLDLKHKEVVWSDIQTVSNVTNNNYPIDIEKIKEVVHATKYRLTMFDLLWLHIHARGWDEGGIHEVFDEEYAYKYDEFSSKFLV